MGQWGRKIYQSWPSRHPVWTLAALFGAVVFFGLAIAVQYVRSWSFVERFYLPVYAKTWVRGLFPKAQTRYSLINGVTAKGQQRLALAGEVEAEVFANAIRAAESKLRKSGSPCASDFGADALDTLDSASYDYGVSFATDANGNPTAVADPNIYASTNVASNTVTINMIGYFFDITPTPVAGTDRAVMHDMGTGLNQTNFDAFVLLHELGHVTGVLGDDTGKNQPLADAFNAKILNDCFGIADWKPRGQ